ncbi:MAG: hypothetical protein WCH44_10515, partial [Betaproteobacteria bacterium]
MSMDQASRARPTRQVSTFLRLLSLPAIFSGSDLTMRFQWTSRKASHYLYLWKKRGLVQALGGHSDVFANILIQPQPDWDSALCAAMPSAVVVGVEALRRAGWTTQIQVRPDVAVDESMPVFSVSHFTVLARPPSWFAQSKRGIKNGCLTPAWALADMLHHLGWGACGLQPDDIEWDRVK